jgi:hypothetical protein
MRASWLIKGKNDGGILLLATLTSSPQSPPPSLGTVRFGEQAPTSSDSAHGAVLDYDADVSARFRGTLSPLSIDEAPPSFYPQAKTRFRLVFQRCR